MPTSLQLRNGVQGLSALAGRDLDAVWRQASDATQAGTVLRDILPALIETYGAAAATLAADWYDDFREERSVKKRFDAEPIEPSDRGAQALVGWALTTAKNDNSLRELILGGMQRRIADHSRLTVATSSIADPSAAGWRRVGSGECEFCSMLIGRGSVYREETVDFPAHDSCRCGAEPDFS